MEKIGFYFGKFIDLLIEMPFLIVLVVIIIAIAIIAQWALYEKASQPGISCIVPGWNFISFMKIVGRPGWHAAFVIVPLTILLAVGVVFIDDFANLIKSGFSTAGEMLFPLILFSVSFISLGIFMVNVYVELCNSFGKFSTSDYVLILLFNGFYVFNLGLSYKEKYYGPAYHKTKDEVIEMGALNAA
jgi:hypothetical protein